MSFDFEKLDSLVNGSIPTIKDFNGHFAISTKIPNKFLIDEEKEWDTNLEYPTIKSTINRTIIEKIIKDTNKKYNPKNPQFRIIYDLKKFQFEVKLEPLFIFGRYFKYSREISQTRWVCRKCKGRGCMHCDDKGKNYLSIEEILGEQFKEEFGCENYFLHASGREDVNVENHAGRAFVIQLVEPKKQGNLKKIERVLRDQGKVEIKNLKFVARDFVEMVSNSHFNKTYEVEITSDKKLTKEDIKKIEKLKGFEIQQKTPKRVAHRRANKIRKRKILDVKLIVFKENKATFKIKTEAGTYIKELVHSDGNRTTPSISEILNSDVECSKLTVSKIYDSFLDSI